MSFLSRLFRFDKEATNTAAFTDLFRTLTGMPSMVSKKTFLKEHPQLLTEDATAILSEVAARQQSPGARAFLADTVALLDRCRQTGIDKAFEEYAARVARASQGEDRLLHVLGQFMNARSLEEAQLLLRGHPELLGPEADELLTKDDNSDPRVRLFLESRRTLLRRCREVGIDQAFLEKGAEQDKTRNEPDRLASAFSALIEAADSKAQLDVVLKRYPELLSTEADSMLQAFAATQGSDEQAWVRRMRRLLADRRR